MWGEPSCGRQPATATDGLEGDRVCVTKKWKRGKRKKRKGKKTGPDHGQRVLHHKNLVLLHNLLDECKDGKWMNNVREDILLVHVFLHRTFLV